MEKEFFAPPNTIHPEKPSAVASRNSLVRENRNEYLESKLVIDEEVDKILNQISAKLPPEVLEKLDIQGNIKSKLHNYYNQNLHNMLNRYITSVEDELAKKYRDLITKEENRNLSEYTPRYTSDLLEEIGGLDKFNTSELEQSLVNIFGHLQGAMQRGVTDLEHQTNSLLRKKTDVGALIRGENTFAIAKCSFRDNIKKPANVMDAILAVNLTEAELISPIVHLQEPVIDLLKSMISEHAHTIISTEVEKVNEEVIDEGLPELNETEMMFHKFKGLDNYFSNESEKDDDKRYSLVEKRYIDSLEQITDHIPQAELDPLRLRENVKHIIDDINLRNRGFNTIVNTLTHILDSSRMGYQHISNYKNSRHCIINEYSTKNTKDLPDERYQVNAQYYDTDQLLKLRESYAKQYDEFVIAFDEFYGLIQAAYEKYKKESGMLDYQEIEKEYLKSDAATEEDGEDTDVKEDATEPLWQELAAGRRDATSNEEGYSSYSVELNQIQARITYVKKLVKVIYKNTLPTEREIVHQRLDFLVDKFNEFSVLVNPFHIQPGILLTINVTSVKKKLTTMYAIANVLNEFLSAVSQGFQDAAFATFSRRRSTVRDDFDGEFAQYDPNADNMDRNETEESLG